jgi:hypothetical protein
VLQGCVIVLLRARLRDCVHGCVIVCKVALLRNANTEN